MTPRPRGWDIAVPSQFESLYTDYYNVVLCTIQRSAKDQFLAEDLTSMVWLKILKIWQESGGLQHVHNMKAYLTCTARRMWISHIRDLQCRNAKLLMVQIPQDCLPCQLRRTSQDEVDDKDQLEALLPNLNPVQKFVLTGIAAHKSYEIIAKEICDAGLRATCSKSGVGEIVETIRKIAKKVLGFDNF